MSSERRFGWCAGQDVIPGRGGTRQGFNERTSGRFPCIAVAHGIRENLLHRLKVANLRFNLSKMPGRNLAHLGASALAVRDGKGQQRTNFIEGEA